MRVDYILRTIEENADRGEDVFTLMNIYAQLHPSAFLKSMSEDPEFCFRSRGEEEPKTNTLNPRSMYVVYGSPMAQKRIEEVASRSYLLSLFRRRAVAR